MTGSRDRIPYQTAKDFDRALTDRIASAALILPYGVPQLRRQFAHGRLLARLFLHEPERWVLKGATGLLARMPRMGTLVTSSHLMWSRALLCRETRQGAYSR